MEINLGRAKSRGEMAEPSQDPSRMISSEGKARIPTQMEMSIEGTFPKIKNVVKEFILGMMAENTTEAGQMTKDRVWANITGLMALILKGVG